MLYYTSMLDKTFFLATHEFTLLLLIAATLASHDSHLATRDVALPAVLSALRVFFFSFFCARLFLLITYDRYTIPVYTYLWLYS